LRYSDGGSRSGHICVFASVARTPKYACTAPLSSTCRRNLALWHPAQASSEVRLRSLGRFRAGLLMGSFSFAGGGIALVRRRRPRHAMTVARLPARRTIRILLMQQASQCSSDGGPCDRRTLGDALGCGHAEARKQGCAGTNRIRAGLVRNRSNPIGRLRPGGCVLSCRNGSSGSRSIYSTFAPSSTWLSGTSYESHLHMHAELTHCVTATALLLAAARW
jgi:hypothetical protein